MSDMVFHEPPSVELLRWLARGSLKQHLLRAVRLWVWLRFFYGDAEYRADLPASFIYADCRDIFFTASHPREDGIPKLHDPACPCAKTAADWLFTVGALSPAEWRQAIERHHLIQPEKLNDILQQRPFAVTRRSLTSDLQALADLGWLNYDSLHYRHVSAFPRHPIAPTDAATAASGAVDAFSFLPPDLAEMAHSLSDQKDGSARFFLHLPYGVPPAVTDQVADWPFALKQLWASTPIPPIKLTYRNAPTQKIVSQTVYPVCAYYAQRAVYLCGFNPELPHSWYNYRLDQILQLTPIHWQHADVPDLLQQLRRKDRLPTPEYVEQEMDKAWGFDFYRPSKQLLLRFDQEFHEHYVKATDRHATFQQISYGEAKQHLEQQPSAAVRQALSELLQQRSPMDAYYRVYYRDGDTNIRQQLRAWRPAGEVLLPWHLRQEMAAEVATEFQRYFPQFSSLSFQDF